MKLKEDEKILKEYYFSQNKDTFKKGILTTKRDMNIGCFRSFLGHHKTIHDIFIIFGQYGITIWAKIIKMLTRHF